MSVALASASAPAALPQSATPAPAQAKVLPFTTQSMHITPTPFHTVDTVQ